MMRRIILSLVLSSLLMASTKAANLGRTSHHQTHDKIDNAHKNSRVQKAIRELQTSPAWPQLGGDVDGEAAGDHFGWDVSMSADGTRIAVAGVLSDNGSVRDAGHVRVFEYASNNQWTLLGQVINGDKAYDMFGESVSLSGDGTTLAIGSTQNNFPLGTVVERFGFVRVYRYNTAIRVWQKLGDSDIKAQSEKDIFGASVAMSDDGSRVVIGAPWNEGNDYSREVSVNSVGVARVFEYVNPSWRQVGTDLNGAEAGDKSGTSVAINKEGTIVAVGAPTESGDNRGSVRVYRKLSSAADWTLTGSVIPGTVASEQSGYSVALSENGLAVAIGSPMYTVPASGSIAQIVQTGRVRAFAFVNGGWTQRGSSILSTRPAEKMYFGRDVALSSSGNDIIAGAPYNAQTGFVGVYELAGGSTDWALKRTITGQTKSDQFGISVGLGSAPGGDRVVIGAQTADPNGIDSGKAQVYQEPSRSITLPPIPTGWNLQLEDNLALNFGAGTEPEFTFTFSGTAPTANTGRTFKVEVLLWSVLCDLGPPRDNAVAPVQASGPIGDLTSFRFRVQLTVDAATVTSSDLFVSRDNEERGELAFCLGVDVFEGTDRKAALKIRTAVDLVMTQEFEFGDFELDDRDGPDRVPVRVIDVTEESQFDYTLETSFCDRLGGAALPNGGPLKPGEELSVCIDSKDGEGASVIDVRSVSFEIEGAPLARVDLIDDLGNVIDPATTTKQCGGGGCRVTALTIPDLYEYNGQDVSNGVFMTGRAVYKFGSRRGLQESDAAETTFSIKLNLATPPDRSRQGSAGNMSVVFAFAAAMAGTVLLLH